MKKPIRNLGDELNQKEISKFEYVDNIPHFSKFFIIFQLNLILFEMINLSTKFDKLKYFINRKIYCHIIVKYRYNSYIVKYNSTISGHIVLYYNSPKPQLSVYDFYQKGDPLSLSVPL